MKSSGAGQTRVKIPASCPAFWAMGLSLLLVLPLSLLATEAGAAKIIFEPNELSTTVAPGEVATIPVAVSLTETTAANSYASFSLSLVEGSIDPTWMKGRIPVSLNSTSKTRQVLFQINVPAEAQGGQYMSVFRTEGLRSSEQVATADLVINVAVSEPFACNQVPLFSDISSTEDTINVRKHRKVAIDLSGVVSVQEGCNITNAWYQLTDEYGELDTTEPLEINDDGTFSVAIPMVASRKGKDKDGRLYTVKFMAENEIGVGESPETSVVVLHDKRKKGHHDGKKMGHDSKRKSHDGKKAESRKQKNSDV